jgi:hypothetical protein
MFVLVFGSMFVMVGTGNVPMLAMAVITMVVWYPLPTVVAGIVVLTFAPMVTVWVSPAGDVALVLFLIVLGLELLGI